MKKKIYETPDFGYGYIFESDVMFTSGGYDTLIDDDNIFDLGRIK